MHATPEARAARMADAHRLAATALRAVGKRHFAAIPARAADVMQLFRAHVAYDAKPDRYAREQAAVFHDMGAKIRVAGNRDEGDYAWLVGDQLALLADVVCGDIGKPRRQHEHEPVEEPIEVPTREPVPA